ncbi:MAG: hypothetical protein FWC34_11540 [Bacteroidetes bacterium]|nr:hypothetical protein [Bacteroidota bacterium]MCL2302191.1 hypothetical protein [Lentimicrobiaceae bacterium]MCL2302271.1 hypothetical protein [Lentimicrobiaceae bacterium]
MKKYFLHPLAIALLLIVTMAACKVVNVSTEGVVTAKTKSVATITATTQEGNYTATCAVEVIDVENDEGVIINGVKWATRNLASHGKFVLKTEDIGALFQWGRAGDGHEQRTSPNYPTNNNSSENGVVSGFQNFDAHGQIVNTHAAYGKFIKQSDEPYDWRAPQNGMLWNSGSETVPKKTANDPCPDGWRLPTQTELASLGNGVWVWANTPVAGRRFVDGSNTLFLPAAGYRDASGTLSNVGTRGLYWSSSISGANAFAFILAFNSNGFYMYSNYHVVGFSVRCVAEH